VLVERSAESIGIGDVARDERHSAELVFGEDEPEPGVVASEVVADRLLAEIEEGFDRPGAEAPEGAGD